jgi:hypothetical protein
VLGALRRVIRGRQPGHLHPDAVSRPVAEQSSVAVDTVSVAAAPTPVLSSACPRIWAAITIAVFKAEAGGRRPLPVIFWLVGLNLAKGDFPAK